MIYLGYSCKYLAFTQYFKSSHKAVDIPRSVTVDGVKKPMANENVYMAYDGKIVKNSYASDYGYYVEYEVKDGADTYLIASGHFDTKSPLKVGKTYARGTLINKMGRTGSGSTGYHDHFRVTKNGTRVNPLEYCYAYTDWNVKGSKEFAEIKWYTPVLPVVPVDRDTTKDQVRVLKTLNVRKGAGTDTDTVGKAYKDQIFNNLGIVEASDYNWIKIADNQYLAQDKANTYLEMLPKEIIDYKELYEQELEKNNKLELELKDVNAQLVVSNGKLSEIKDIL